jgi:hypothetical protein
MQGHLRNRSKHVTNVSAKPLLMDASHAVLSRPSHAIFTLDFITLTGTVRSRSLESRRCIAEIAAEFVRFKVDVILASRTGAGKIGFTQGETDEESKEREEGKENEETGPGSDL